MARTLHQRGILTKLRNSAGQDVDGGCGQLRARVGEVPVRFERANRNPANLVTPALRPVARN
jgi:23S rRNA (adenine2503-C2)-methyltransferase